MIRVTETPNGQARAGTTTRPKTEGERTGPSVLVRIVRTFYAVLCSAFVACVVLQVFFAGMGAFGADWSWHVTFVHFLEPLPLLMIPVAFAGRLPWSLRLLPVALLVMIGAQYAFANTAVPAAAVHPVNALLIFLISLFMARRSWATVAGRREG